MKRLFTRFIMLLALTGCYAGMELDQNIAKFSTILPTIQLGDSKQNVLSKLTPLHQPFYQSELRPATQFRKGEDNYYVHYQRSAWYEDGRITDDEFTPFIFANDTLIEIGWYTLTASTTGQTTYDNSDYAVGILESLEKINESRTKTSSSSSAKQSNRVKTKCFSQTTTGGHTIINCN